MTAQLNRLNAVVRPGDQDRTPLLLMNGIGARLEALQPFVDALDPAIPVIRFDPPGVGGAVPSRVPYRFTTLSYRLARLLDELGHDQVDVLGISWGGGLAQQFALTQRRRVRRLVLVATGTGSLMVPARPGVLRHMLTPRRYLDTGYLREVSGSLYGGSARADPDMVERLLHKGRPSGYAYQLLAGAGWTSLPLLPLITQPTLVLAGDDDPIIPLANSWLLRTLIPRAERHIYPGGHLELVCDPPRLVPAIERFFAQPTEPTQRS
ncbi:poly(3-hydroxyalkanoate) depolymerase [Pseudonocardia eucalypti]|uniref:Poly(3-hydroxyalkanoate) depolymerase n=1 Tax=Pseudonocardia eucalypti TaxID=648755 RepID=A0ABP9QG79_9PSEU|nr:poly(3-hydroxyalkanoate) depolymerase [Pseudonocardia eucalypti]